MPSTSNSSTEPNGPAALLEVGKIVRAHGLKGDLVIGLTTDRIERVAVGSVLDTDRGPITIASSRKDRDNKWMVRIVGCDTREQADALRGLVLRAEPIDDPDALWVHELIGCHVVDEADGRDRGEVVAVLPNPASDLLELDSGHLVPLRFVVGGVTGAVVRVDVPDGLWDLL